MVDIESEVKETIEKYSLLQKDEKVVVALSGGKDSTSVLYILNNLGYNVEGLMIHLCMGEWSDTHKRNMIKFCEQHDIPLTIVDFKEEVGKGICYLKDVMKARKNLSGSTVCGIMKRWVLNRWAKKLGADKLATGHNLDDETENIFMNFLKGNLFLGINSAPISRNLGDLENEGIKIVKEGFVPRIKPLFFVDEDDIREYTKKNGFEILYDQCSCSFDSYRAHTREWIESLSGDEKRKIVKGFLDLVPKISEGIDREIYLCKKCGEPGSSEVCNACAIFIEVNSLSKAL